MEKERRRLRNMCLDYWVGLWLKSLESSCWGSSGVLRDNIYQQDIGECALYFGAYETHKGTGWCIAVDICVIRRVVIVSKEQLPTIHGGRRRALSIA